MSETIYSAMEFYGTGDPFFGGSAADWCLYTTEDGGQAFISTPEANRRMLVKSYFPAEEEARQAAELASTRGGKLSALPVPLLSQIPLGQLRWIAGQFHVGTSDSDLCAEIERRAMRGGIRDDDVIAQLCAYVLVSHRRNQALVRHFRL